MAHAHVYTAVEHMGMVQASLGWPGLHGYAYGYAQTCNIYAQSVMQPRGKKNGTVKERSGTHLQG